MALSSKLAQFRGRWRVALRYGAREVKRNKGRTIFTVILIALPVAVGIMIVSLINWSNNPADAIAWRLGGSLQAEIWSAADRPVIQTPDGMSGVQAADGLPILETTRPLADIQAEVAQAFPHVETSMALFREVQIVPQQQVGTHQPTSVLVPPIYVLAQVDLSIPGIAERYQLSAGRWPVGAEIAIAPLVAAEMGVELGDWVEVIPPDTGVASSAQIVGILSGAIDASAVASQPDGPLQTPELVDSAGYPFNTVLWYVADTPITWAQVRAANELGLNVVSRDVLLNPPPLAEVAVEYHEYLARGPGGWDPQLQLTLAGIAALALLEMVFLIGPAFAVGARRSERNMALIAANGGAPRTLYTAMLAIGLVTGALAATAGLALGLLAAAIFRVYLFGWQTLLTHNTLTWPMSPLPVALIWLVGTLLATVAAWLPARRAARVEVVAALTGRRSGGVVGGGGGSGGGGLGDGGGSAGVGDSLSIGGSIGSGQRPGGGGALDGVSRRAWLSLAMVVVGGAGALITGWWTGQLLAVSLFMLLGLVGLVLGIRDIVLTTGRVAANLPVSWRLATRDAGRNLGRSVPAIAAVLVACAAAAAASVFLASGARNNYQNTVTVGGQNVIVISTLSDSGIPDDDVLLVSQLMHEIVPDVGTLYPISGLITYKPDTNFSMWVVPPLERLTTINMAEGNSIRGPVVATGNGISDDELLRMLGIPDPQQAAATLADGRVLVQGRDIHADGTALVQVGIYDGTWQTELASFGLEIPAFAATAPEDRVNLTLPILPLSVVSSIEAEIAESEPEIRAIGLVADAPRLLTEAERIIITQQLRDLFTVGRLQSELDIGQGGSGGGLLENMPLTILLTGGALLLALAAAWIATALAATESRPDLATMTAVGAAPKTRKTVVGAQAGIIAVTGVLLGVVPGAVFGISLVFAQTRRGFNPDTGAQLIARWPLDMPWLVLLALAVLLPVLAVASAQVVTRAQPTLTRRLGE